MTTFPPALLRTVTVRTRQLEYFDIFPSFDIPWPAEILSFDLEYSI